MPRSDFTGGKSKLQHRSRRLLDPLNFSHESTIAILPRIAPWILVCEFRTQQAERANPQARVAAACRAVADRPPPPHDRWHVMQHPSTLSWRSPASAFQNDYGCWGLRTSATTIIRDASRSILRKLIRMPPWFEELIPRWRLSDRTVKVSTAARSSTAV